MTVFALLSNVTYGAAAEAETSTGLGGVFASLDAAQRAGGEDGALGPWSTESEGVWSSLVRITTVHGQRRASWWHIEKATVEYCKLRVEAINAALREIRSRRSSGDELARCARASVGPGGMDTPGPDVAPLLRQAA